MIDELFRAAMKYRSNRETYYKMPESQKHIVKPDFDFAKRKLKQAINVIIDKRIGEYLKNVKLPKASDEKPPVVLNAKVATTETPGGDAESPADNQSATKDAGEPSADIFA